MVHNGLMFLHFMGYSYLRILVPMNIQQTNESTYIALSWK